MKHPNLSRGDGITNKDTFIVEAVGRLQTYLINFGFLPEGEDDKKFGPKTENAVKSFQVKNGLLVTGQVSYDTWKVLFKYPLVSYSQLKSVYQNSKISSSQIEDLNYCLNYYLINTPIRIRHFLSQTGHESGGLRFLVEKSSGDKYEGREDLGNTELGDGPKFKGAGVIQLTGRSNYTLLQEETSDLKVLEEGCNYVARTYPFTSAGVWWDKNQMNELCDKNPTVKEVTRRVNGGYNGLEDRETYYKRACKYILVSPF